MEHVTAKFVYSESGDKGVVYNTGKIKTVVVKFEDEDIKSGEIVWDDGTASEIDAESTDMLLIELLGHRPW